MEKNMIDFLEKLKERLQEDPYDAPKEDLNATIDDSIDMVNKFMREIKRGEFKDKRCKHETTEQIETMGNETIHICHDCGAEL